MKKIICLSLIIIWGNVLIAQHSIEYGIDKCAYCGMVISDELHAAQAIDANDQVLNFDAIEGLINFLRSKDETDFPTLYIADYANGGYLTDARVATYLRSENIPSPMGAFLSGFSVREDANEAMKEKGGELFTWDEIKVRFQDSRFGIIDHSHHNHNQPDAYAPIGIMGDHLHPAKGFMVSIRYMRMNMKGNLNGSSNEPISDIHESYMVAPDKMSMNMYMLGAMYAPTDNVTLMIMQNFVTNDMDVINRMGMGFSTHSSGVGDTRVGALVGLLNGQGSHKLHLNSALNLPTGSISQRDNTPMQEDMKLPYPMQLGSGTYDLQVGLTYKGSLGRVSWGIQQMNLFRTGENKSGFRWGNQYSLNGWTAFRLAERVSFSWRLEGQIYGEIEGVDDELNPMMIPTANAQNSGSELVRTHLGFNIIPAFGQLSRLGIALEAGLPLYQHVNGVQMKEQFSANAGIRYTF